MIGVVYVVVEDGGSSVLRVSISDSTCAMWGFVSRVSEGAVKSMSTSMVSMVCFVVCDVGGTEVEVVVGATNVKILAVLETGMWPEVVPETVFFFFFWDFCGLAEVPSPSAFLFLIFLTDRFCRPRVHWRDVDANTTRTNKGMA